MVSAVGEEGSQIQPERTGLIPAGDSDQANGLTPQWSHKAALLGSGRRLETELGAGRVLGTLPSSCTPSLPPASGPSGTEAQPPPWAPTAWCPTQMYRVNRPWPGCSDTRNQEEAFLGSFSQVLHHCDTRVTSTPGS